MRPSNDARERAKDASVEIQQIEQPLFKRPWLGVQGVFHRDGWTYEESAKKAIEAFLLDEAERFLKSVAPRVLRAKDVATHVLASAPCLAIARMRWGDQAEAELEGLCVTEAVPFTRVHVFSPTGMLKALRWSDTWSLQGLEDLGKKVAANPVPPKYDQKDYRDPSFWRMRGKLDVPKERFISYPGCGRDAETGVLVGWAGWNHLQRAQALVALFQERKNDDGWPPERLMPLLVGLQEVMFWLELWHRKPEAGSQDPAREFRQFLDAELHALHVTVEDLAAWRPAARSGSSRRKVAAISDTAEAAGEGASGISTVKTKRKPRRKADDANETQ